MTHINIEIKAKIKDHSRIRYLLESESADFKGIEHQVDTYFKVNFGRLKLREGDLERTLIFYDRKNQKGPKQSNIILFNITKSSTLKEILSKSLGVLVVVDKQRELYLVDNIRFHLDVVKGLGSFIEIEAVDYNGVLGREKLFKQCKYYLNLFQIPTEDLISVSYSDLLLAK